MALKTIPVSALRWEFGSLSQVVLYIRCHRKRKKKHALNELLEGGHIPQSTALLFVELKDRIQGEGKEEQKI